MDLKRRRQMYDQVLAACEQFQAKYNPASIDDAVIELFLEETAHIELEQESRLIFFASSCFQRFGWEGSSKVHRYVVDRNADDDYSSYAIWINEGLALMGNESEEFEYRKRIAEDVEKLITEAGKGDDEWVACFWASFYVKHPLRDDRDPKWLLQATKWREISVAELRSRSTNELGPHELCELADLYRQLGRLDQAAQLYTEALSYELPACCENSSASSIQERLTMCRSSD